MRGEGHTIDNSFGMEDRLVDNFRAPHERCTVFQREKSRGYFKTQRHKQTPTVKQIEVGNLQAPDRTIGANIIPFL